jgi:hypothetical protein
VTGRTSQDPGKVLANLQADVYASALFAALRNNYSTTFAQDTAPTTRANGDALLSGDEWIDTNDSNQRYVWDTTLVPPAWAIKVSKEVTAILTDVSHVQTVASDGSRGYFQPTQPLATQSRFNDIWIDTSQTTPLTITAIYRYEDASSGSTGTLSWRSAPSNAVGKSYVEAYNTKAIVNAQTVTLQEHFTTLNALEGQYSLRINANGTIAGFGLSAGTEGCLVNGILDTSLNEASCTGTGKVWVPASSSFVVNASTFAVTGSNAAGSTIPFVVDTVTGEVGIQGSLIVDGTITANQIAAGTITGDLIAGSTITGTHINAGTITSGHITTGGLSADSINTSSLSAIVANLGTVNAGKMQSADGKFVIDLDNKFIKIEV